MPAYLGHQPVPAGDHRLLGQQGGTGERARAGQPARVARDRQHDPDLVRVQLGEHAEDVAQRYLGPRARRVRRQMLLVLRDLRRDLVIRDEAGAPGPDPGHEAGAAAHREGRRPRCGGHAG
ncbi:MAG: hypothetical protein AUG44_28080 [Actinobacteria bacterium 13_1_20CM_3_71_11]|nr:MAG: hypothetical protein AUG44_28080 [Actinobacteria bacterium 13_1_20CM_3_71_11]